MLCANAEERPKESDNPPDRDKAEPESFKAYRDTEISIKTRHVEHTVKVPREGKKITDGGSKRRYLRNIINNLKNGGKGLNKRSCNKIQKGYDHVVLAG